LPELAVSEGQDGGIM